MLDAAASYKEIKDSNMQRVQVVEAKIRSFEPHIETLQHIANAVN